MWVLFSMQVSAKRLVASAAGTNAARAENTHNAVTAIRICIAFLLFPFHVDSFREPWSSQSPLRNELKLLRPISFHDHFLSVREIFVRCHRDLLADAQCQTQLIYQSRDVNGFHENNQCVSARTQILGGSFNASAVTVVDTGV